MRKTFLAGVAVIGLTGAFSEGASAQQPPLMNWTGFYIGAHAGWGEARFSGDWIDTSGNEIFPWRTRPDGFLFGAHTGQNWQFNTFVLGWEGDVSGTPGWSETVCCFQNPSQSVTTKMSLLASLRARLGVLLNPNTLVFLTGGVGYTQAKAIASWPPLSGTAKFHDYGTVFGGGIEWKQNQNFSWRLETLWYVFDESRTIQLNASTFVNVKLKDAVVVRIGGTWHY